MSSEFGKAWVVSAALALFAGCIEVGGPGASPCEEDERVCSGGEGTVFDTTRQAFGFAARNLDASAAPAFEQGRALFDTPWSAPGRGDPTRDGLGPVFNATACAACHVRDGRAAPYDREGRLTPALLVRLSVPGDEPEPTYGEQLNPFGAGDVPGEARVSVTWSEERGRFEDGTPYTLRRPTFGLDELAYGPLAEEVMMSPRATQPMHGLGLLEAIDGRDILAGEDAEDADGDGISGRANLMRDEATGALVLGRFGWKAGQPTLEAQNAAAFLGDMGITSPLHTEQSCTQAQRECLEAPGHVDLFGEGAELSRAQLDEVTFYTRHLAVPARRGLDDPLVARGRERFEQAGCGGCHVPRWVTREDAVSEALSGQVIFPYTDLLLHDMGEGLADGRPEGRASGSEWRTPPLWGVGLTPEVNGHMMLLHDGRARDLSEAILWHGGEAEASRRAFEAMDAAAREELLAFVRSL